MSIDLMYSIGAANAALDASQLNTFESALSCISLVDPSRLRGSTPQERVDLLWDMTRQTREGSLIEKMLTRTITNEYVNAGINNQMLPTLKDDLNEFVRRAERNKYFDQQALGGDTNLPKALSARRVYKIAYTPWMIMQSDRGLAARVLTNASDGKPDLSEQIKLIDNLNSQGIFSACVTTSETTSGHYVQVHGADVVRLAQIMDSFDSNLMIEAQKRHAEEYAKYYAPDAELRRNSGKVQRPNGWSTSPGLANRRLVPGSGEA